MKAVVHQSTKDKQWYAEFKGNNNETWFVSEGYTEQRTGLASVEGFYDAIGGSVPLEIKVVDLSGITIENFTIHRSR